MINYNNFNYLYNKNGKTVAVKSNTAEGEKLQGANAASGSGAASGASSVSGSSAAYSSGASSCSGASNSSAASYEWIMLDNVNLSDCITVEEFSVNQVVTLFSDGNLTVPELRQWFKSNGVQGATVKNTNGTYEVNFEYNGKKYNTHCTFENARYQTDDKHTREANVRQENNSDSVNNASGIGTNSDTKVGSGIWTPYTLKQAKLSSEEIKKYFEAVNANPNYLRFNVEVIKATFPDKTINTPEQLKAAIEEQNKKSADNRTINESENNSSKTELVIITKDNSYTSYDANVLKDIYGFTDADIGIFFEEKDGKYQIRQSAIQNCFNLGDYTPIITTAKVLLNAIEDYGLSEGYVRGAYSLSEKVVQKYLMESKYSTNEIKKYTLNKEAINADFPNSSIHTLGQLKEAIASKNIVETEDDSNKPKYNKDYLINECNFTEKDLSVYFKSKDGQLIIKTSFVKNAFSDKNVETVEDLLANIKEAKYSDGDVKGLFGFSDDEIYALFTQTEDGMYVLNQDAIKEAFPEEDINTLGQLRKTATDSGYVAPDITEEKKTKFLKEIVTAFSEGDSKWGFNKLAPTGEQVDELFNKLLKDEEITNFTGKVSEFKNFIKTKAAEYVKNIVNVDQITLFSKGELSGRYGLSLAAVQMFFTKDENGNYKMNMDAINEFYNGYNRDTMKKLQDFDMNYPLGTTRKETVCNFITEALRNEDPEWGFDKFDPKLTEEEIRSFYYQIMSIDCRNLSLGKFEQKIRENLPKIKNNIQLQRYDNLIAGDEYNYTVSSQEALETISVYAKLLSKKLQYNCNYSDDFINSVIEFAISNLNIPQDDENSYTYQILGEKQEFNLKSVLTTFKDNCKNILDYTRFSYKFSTVKFDENGKFIPTGEVDKEGNPIYEHETVNKWNDKKGMDSYRILEWLKMPSDDIQENYFKDLIQTKLYGDLKLTNYETKCFINAAISRVSRIIGKEDNGYITQSELAKLNKNADSTWIDEFYTIVEDIAKNVKHIDQEKVDNATSLDIDTLFNGKSTIDAKYVLNNLNEMLVSTDPGVRKFAKIIEQCCTIDLKQSLKSGKDDNSTLLSRNEKIDRINWLLVFLNDKCGIPNTEGYPTENVAFTPELINKLGSKIFDNMEEIFKDQKWRNCVLANINGVIEDFVQEGGTKGTNDCWLLSGALAINSTPSGKAMIKNAIKWNSDYTEIIVTYPNYPDRPINIPVGDILQADRDIYGTDSYLSHTGDNDVLALAIAYEYIHHNDKVSVGGNGKDTFETIEDVINRLLTKTMKYGDTFLEDFLPSGTSVYDEHVSALELVITGIGSTGVIGGPLIGGAVGGLLGPTGGMIGSIIGGISGATGDDKVEMDESDVLSYLRQILNAKRQGNNVAATFVLLATASSDYSCRTVDYDIWTYNDFVAAHVMAITDITPTTVTFVNPDGTGSAKEFTVRWSDFAKIGIAELSWAVW